MNIQPGDILVTRDVTWWARLIRFGAAMRDEPDSWNHVIVASHVDAARTFWGIEARPGGVGWVDLAPWINNRWTISNCDQPKTPQQRSQVVKVVTGMLGTPYDWAGIVADAMVAIDARRLWRLRDFGATGAPAHVVCSSLASWVYTQAGLTGPAAVALRTVTPADWARFILRRDWDVDV